VFLFHFFEPLPIFDISVRLKVGGRVAGVKALCGGIVLDYSIGGRNELSFALPKLELFETIVVEFD
jgi:hypothetical protein